VIIFASSVINVCAQMKISAQPAEGPIYRRRYFNEKLKHKN
jgi:hypothetical protein